METNMTANGDGKGAALAAALQKAVERHEHLRKAAAEHLRSKMTRWLEVLGLSGELNVGLVTVDFAIKVETEQDSRGYKDSIDVYFRPDWILESETKVEKRRVLEVSFNSIRLGGGRGTDALMAKAAGRFAERLAEIESGLRDFDWESYDGAEREVRTARGALRMHEAENAAAEYKRKTEAFRAKLERGVRIDFFAKSVYQGGDSVGAIEWISPKCVFFTGGRVKRATIPETLKMLVNGEWRIVE